MNLSRLSQFWSKIDCFWSKFDKRSKKSIWQSKKSIYIEKVDQIRPFLIRIDLKLNFQIFLPSAGIDFIVTIQNSTTNTDQNLISRWFESDLIRILSLGRLDCISLPHILAPLHTLSLFTFLVTALRKFAAKSFCKSSKIDWLTGWHYPSLFLFFIF